ncbi:DNA topoisomerase 1 [Frankliniella fusca]|uniref:DNA topoisomerase 1 n=1 Tax=Frankliniella fusca TaxID=407009 RepID=A0AAE1I403_9NEOP|nr:DNA topoisomerase 1 [Frankliniella fusca]
MWKINQELKWTSIEKLQEEDAGNKFKTHKLTKAHVELTSFSRMGVSLACQALSMSVAEALDKLREDERFNDIIERDKLINELSPYTSIEDSRFEFLEKIVLGYFDNWLKDVQARRGKFSPTDRKKMFISMESYESLHITVHGFCGAVKYCLQKLNVSSVDARNFNQDKLEQEFGSLRMSEGSQNNPTLHRAIQRVMSRHVSKSAALPPKKGNTEARKRI